MPTLTALSLWRCPAADDEALRAIARAPKLFGINLDHCTQVTDAGVAHLAELKTLKHLKLTGSGATPEGVRTLRGLPRLKVINAKLVADFWRELDAKKP